LGKVFKKREGRGRRDEILRVPKTEKLQPNKGADWKFPFMESEYEMLN